MVDKLNQKITDITEDLNKELELDMSNLDKVIMRLPMIYNNYLQKWYAASRQIDILEIEMSNMWGELYGYYKVSYEFDLTNAELKTMIENNVDRNKVKLKLMQVKTYVEFLEKCLENINNCRWTAKSMIDYHTFITGNK